MRPGLVIILLWLGFIVSWWVAAAWSQRPEKQAGVRAELGYRLVLFAGVILFSIPARRYHGPLRLWHVTYAEAWICGALIFLGFSFAWWARIHLGRLWSGWITRKPDHQVIDTGPYAIVRHPIYTGLFLAIFATAAVKGTVLGLAGAALLTAGFWMKARLEENWLRKELAPGAYDAYRRRVPMLLPFGPK